MSTPASFSLRAVQGLLGWVLAQSGGGCWLRLRFLVYLIHLDGSV